MSISFGPDAWRRSELGRGGGGMRRWCGSAGFTLLEILVAVAVLGIVVLAALGGLSAVQRSAVAIETNLARVHNAPVFLERLRKDLEALVVVPAEEFRPPDVTSDPDPYRFYCERTVEDPADFVRLEFASQSHLPLADDELPGQARCISQVAYFVRPTDEGHIILRAAVVDLRREFAETPAAAVICRQVQGLEYAFEGEDGDTRETWNSDDSQWDFATPRAVLVQLELTDGARYRLRIPLIVGREPRE